MPKVVIYTTPTCGYCHLAKAYFTENSIAYEEKNVSTDLVAREEMLKMTQQSGVPVINIDSDFVVGFDQQKIAQLLGI
jgi:glutaredoxin-like YruB-family protein